MKTLTSLALGTSHRRPAMLDTGSWQPLSSLANDLAMLAGFGMLAAHLVQPTDAFADDACAVVITATVNQSIAEADADLLLAQFAKYEIAGAKSCVAGGAIENPANCSVTLESPGGAKLKVVKAVKAYTGLGLKESKTLVDTAPSVIKKGASKQDVASGKAQLQQAGGTATTACVTETTTSLCSVTMSIHLDEDLETAEAEALKGQLTKAGAVASTACEP